jgi:succinate-semialdehyde dehydrogenase/glutarate-semialdehyde dehydrogenase
LEWLGAPAPSHSAFVRQNKAMTAINVLNPATGDVVGSVPRHSIQQCLGMAVDARTEFHAWKMRTGRERGEMLRRAFEMMMAQQEELAELIVRENGKVLSDARAEVAYAAEFFRWFSEEAVRIDGDLRQAPNGSNWLAVTREPVGVALCITPWNFPAAMATRKIAPALAAGCTVVLKPATETPLTAIAIVDILERCGVPANAVQVITPDPPGDAVQALLESGHIQKLSFTGSTRVGSLLLSQAATRIVNCSMELGGNAPFIVCDDADIDAAVDGAMIAKMRNGGAACTAANRFYVHTSVHDEFVEKFVSRMSALTLGNGLSDGVTLGPLVSATQQQRVHQLLQTATAHGAHIACGGGITPQPMNGVEATVLTKVGVDNPVLAEEIFGPVAPIVRIDSIEDSMPLFNGVQHGLVSYLYTRDLARGMRLSQQLEAGMIGLNRGLVSDPAAPFGGVKESGLGREGGHDGLLAFLETKYVSTEW